MSQIQTALVNKNLIELLIQLNKIVSQDNTILDTLESLVEGLPDELACQAIEFTHGCFRFSSLLSSTVELFYKHSCGQTASRQDVRFYVALTYLILFQFERLGLQQVVKLLEKYSPKKIYSFLCFLLNRDNINTWIFQEWSKSYDITFVKVNLSQPLLTTLEIMEDYISELKLKTQCSKEKVTSPIKKSAPTQVQPFNLTQPKPRCVPTPEIIPILKPFKPVPENVFKEPSELTELQKAKEENAKFALMKLQTAQTTQPRCANAEKSDKTKARIQEIIKQREKYFKEGEIRASKSSHVPESNRECNLPVKMNAASILREGVLFQKEEQKRFHELLQLEAGGKDASEYHKWQEQIIEEELEKERTEIEKKHLMGRITYEEAIIAKEQLTEDRKQLVDELKEQRRALLEEYWRDREEEKIKMHQLVEEIAAGKENAKIAKENLLQMKKKIVEEVSKENQALIQAALEQEQEEMERKIAMIQQIRAMERVPIIRDTFVDLTETGGHGLLSEMSIVELNLRLNMMKIAMLDDEEVKRNEIAQSKEERAHLLESTVEYIIHVRANISRENQQTANKKSNFRRANNDQSNDPEVIALKEKLEARQRERMNKTRGKDSLKAK